MDGRGPEWVGHQQPPDGGVVRVAGSHTRATPGLRGQGIAVTSKTRPPDIDFLHDVDPSIADSISKSANYAASERIEPHFVESANMEVRLPLPMRENLPSTFVSAPDIFLDVLVSLKSVLGAEQFVILEQELSAFSEEYRHGHYTACALRIGRTLEHVVYALARDWGVNVNRATLQVLSDLANSFDQLSGAVIAYATTDENERTRRLKLIQDRLVEIQKKLIQLNFDIHSDLHVESTDVPVNVESILRDIRKQFGRNRKVLNALNDIIDNKIVRKILDSRNNAAHASTNGVRRELSKNDIDDTVELLRTALFLFGNVAFAVAEKD